MSRFYACMSDDVRRTCVTSRLSILYLITLILLLLIQLPILTQTAHAQTTYDEPYGLIELSEIPTPDQRTALSDAGITLLDYLYGSTWTASFDTPIDPSSFDDIVSISELQPEQKLSQSFDKAPELIVTNAVDDNLILINVASWDKNALAYLESYGEIKKTNQLFATVEIERNNLLPLTNEENVQWIEPVFPVVTNVENYTYVTENSSRVRDVVELTNSISLRNNFTGGQVNSGIFDKGRVVPIDLLADRLTYSETFTIPVDSNASESFSETIVITGEWATHATFVASTVGEIATEVYFNSYHYDDETPLENSHIDLRVHTVGYEICADTGLYTMDSQLSDQFSRDMPMVYSAGNQGDKCPFAHPDRYSTIPRGWQSAKNSITVGATDKSADFILEDYSNRGPTIDGRIAPTFVVPGEDIITQCPLGTCMASGTSLSAPGFAGVLTLIYDAYRDMMGDSSTILSSADVRALFAATATDLGRVGPDYEYGFGVINGAEALTALPNLHKLETNGQDELLQEITFNVPTNSEKLNVTLAWDDIPYNPLAQWGFELDENNGFDGQTLNNDLELQLLAPDGTEYYPFLLDPDNPTAVATVGVDSINTIEQVVVENPQAGQWTVSVSFNGHIITDGSNPSQEYTVVHAVTPSDSSVPLSVSLSSVFTQSYMRTSFILLMLLVTGTFPLLILNSRIEQ